MARFKLSQTGSRRGLGEEIVKAANAVYEMSGGNGSLSEAQKDELRKKLGPEFQSQVDNKTVRLVFDDEKTVNVIVPFFGSKLSRGSELDEIAVEALGGGVIPGCCQ